MKKIVKVAKIVEESFTTRTLRGSKKAVVKHWFSGVVALLVSSVVPLLQQWHADKQEHDALNVVETRCQKQLEDYKKDQSDRDKAQWEAIQRKRDK